MAKRKTKSAAELKAERDARAAKGLCRTCEDDTPSAFRDVCWKCGRVFYRKLKRGALDESKAIAAGLISAPKNRGVKGGSGFEKAIQKMDGGS